MFKINCKDGYFYINTSFQVLENVDEEEFKNNEIRIILNQKKKILQIKNEELKKITEIDFTNQKKNIVLNMTNFSSS